MSVRLSCEHTGWRRESLKTNMFYFWKGSVVSWNSCSLQFLSGNQEETAFLLRTILRGGLIHIWCSCEYWGQQSDVFLTGFGIMWWSSESQRKLFLISVSWNFIDTGNRRLHRRASKETKTLPPDNLSSVLLRTWQADPSSGPLYLSSVSTEHPEVLSEGVRAHVHACLYLLEPTGVRKTRLTHLCRTDTRWGRLQREET